jgi:hypothetical protein
MSMSERLGSAAETPRWDEARASLRSLTRFRFRLRLSRKSRAVRAV